MTIVPLYAEESLGFTLGDIGYMMGARSIGFVVAMFTMGIISDKVGRKPVLVFGLIGTSILVVVMNFFASFATIAGIIAFIGFTSGAIWIVGPVIALKQWNRVNEVQLLAPIELLLISAPSLALS
jgi:sugar phosphate permease